jgi:hypothetical protein
MEGSIIAAIIAVHIATKATSDMPMVPAPFPIACTCSSVKIQASAVSARIAIHAGAASRSESGKRFEGLSAFKSNVVFDFGEECVRVCVVKLQPWERYLALVSVYNPSVPKNKAERKHQMSVRLALVHVA